MVDAEVRYLIDRQAIVDLLARWCRGVDRGDIELIASCYHVDGTDDHGPFKGTGAEFAEWVTNDALSLFSFAHHNLGQQLIEIGGHRAHCETYYIFSTAMPGGSLIQSPSRYVDVVEREHSQAPWLIRSRRVLTDWLPPDYVNPDGTPLGTSDFVQGSRSRNDPAYQRFQP